MSGHCLKQLVLSINLPRYLTRFLALLAFAFGLSALFFVAACGQTVEAESGGEGTVHSQLAPTEVTLSDGEAHLTQSDPSGDHWSDLSSVALKVFGEPEKPLVSINPLDQTAERQIIMRVGGRAVRSGDSKTLGYFSEYYDLDGAASTTEHQALYGINVYDNGNYEAPVLGVHGMSITLPGEGNRVKVAVGVQGRAVHADKESGTSEILIGMSAGAGTTGHPEVTGHVGTAIGIASHNRNYGSGTMNQAIGFRGNACQIRAPATISSCFTAQLAQPDNATDNNYALIINDDRDNDGSKLKIGFRDSTMRFHTAQYNQSTQNLELDRMGVRQYTCQDVASAPSITADGCNVLSVEDSLFSVNAIDSCNADHQGRVLYVLCASGGETTYSDGRGNLQLNGDFVCGAHDVLTLICFGASGNCLEVSRSDN